MEDEGGVLGNLPRSRPGRRSQKRASGKAGQRAPGKRSANAAADKPAPAPAAQGTTSDDPVGDAVRFATQVPLVGVRVAAGVTRELLRRLPRP